MQTVGILLMVIGIWNIYCGLHSFRPLNMAKAIISDPSNAVETIQDAQGAAAQERSTEEETLATSSGSVEPASDVGSTGSSAAAPAQTGTGPASSTGAGAAAYQAYAQSQLATYGWSIAQMPYLIELWNKESGWNPSADNASSGAYGIPQALPGSKMASAGSNWQTNPEVQINWGLQYIQQRYGSPQAAWAHEEADDWY